MARVPVISKDGKPLMPTKPSQKAIKAHTEAIKGVIKKYKTSPQSTLISHLNPIIRGWANYYSGVVSTDTFNKLDYTIWLMLRAWTVSRCGKADYNISTIVPPVLNNGPFNIGSIGIRLDGIRAQTLRLTSERNNDPQRLNGVGDNGPDFKVIAADVKVPEPNVVFATLLAGSLGIFVKRGKDRSTRSRE